MGAFQCFWVICSLMVLIHGAPKPPGENPEHGNKDVADMDDGLSTTLLPSPELPENWDQTKDDVSTLFLNRSDKTELPYAMALADDSYDGRPIRDDAIQSPKTEPGTLEHLIMRSELYGEPPSMNRDSLRKKRANILSLRSDLGSTQSRVSKMSPRYSTINRRKRDSALRSSDLRHLLSLWEAEQRRNEEPSSPYSSPDYLNQDYIDESLNDRDEPDERWLDEPVYPSSRYTHALLNPQMNYQSKFSRYQYPKVISPDPTYLQNLEAIRKKRQWAELDYKDRLSKRFMVAKKRSPTNYIRPRENIYMLNDLLQASEMNANPNTYPIKRRMIL